VSAFDINRASLRDVPTYAPDVTTCAIDLRDNVNLWGTPPHALAALQNLPTSALSLYPAVSGEGLTTALAASLGVGRDEVAAGCGSDDLIDAAFRAVAEPGAVIAHPAPSFSMVPIFARLNGLQPIGVPLGADGAADADAMLATGARIIYLCSPNNPTGTVTPAPIVRRIVAESNAIVILDAAYAEFAPDLENFFTEAPALGRLLVLRTFSKAWGLAGLRIGYAVGGADLIRAVRKSSGPYKVNAVAERAAVAALTHDGAWMRTQAAAAVECRDRLANELRSLGLLPLDSRGNFVSVPVRNARRVAARLAEQGIAVRAFDNLPVFGDLLRIGMAPWPVLQQVLAALRVVLA
jgi:histidinol-phosphate aminotransferase